MEALISPVNDELIGHVTKHSRCLHFTNSPLLLGSGGGELSTVVSLPANKETLFGQLDQMHSHTSLKFQFYVKFNVPLFSDDNTCP